MSETEALLAQKVWNLAHVLRDAGVAAGQYVEQITYLLFLKLDAEGEEDEKPSMLPPDCRWQRLAALSGTELTRTYSRVLETLAGQPGLVGTIYAQAMNVIAQPQHLARMVQMVGAETWSAFGIDVKGTIYESLLERTASDTKTGAGQYFTPRPVIAACVAVLEPRPDQTVCDPACGTGGFLLAAFEHMRKHPAAQDRATARRMLEQGFTGFDIVAGVARLAAMNLYLHGIGRAEQAPVHRADALLADPNRRWDLVLTNPPFGRKQAIRVFTGDGDIETEREDYQRPDFPVTTGNKQLNFLQHCMTILAPNGSAAVVLPDNVLFEGGAGERIRRRLLEEFDCHTLLRLPTGIFYKPGVKANVLFFEARPRRREPWTEALWVYDLRTNKRFTLKERPLRMADMEEFIGLARLADRPRRGEAERWKRFTYAELAAREKLDLNLTWLKEDGATDPSTLPPPGEIAAEIALELETASEKFRAVAARLTATTGA
jgi:type I restriction enzyme M protein